MNLSSKQASFKIPTPALLRLCLIMIVWLGALSFAPQAQAQQPLVADLSEGFVAIRTNFTGAKVTLFGATDGDGDVVIVVRGPDQDVTVRLKDRIAGMWINTESVTFSNVPSYYTVAANRPLEELADESVLRARQIGQERLSLLHTPENLLGPELEKFRNALFRNKMAEDLYFVGIKEAVLLGNRLFRTDIELPANTPIGLYEINVYLFRQGQIVDAQTSSLVVSRAGVSANVYEFAMEQALWYGLAALIFALFAGWLAAAAFREN